MNLLLDTHVFLWMLAAPERLSDKARKVLVDPRHTVFLSAVSGVEIAIKRALGKLTAPAGLAEEATHRGLTDLPLTFRHAEVLESLPPHHADPFDRILLAQALAEGLTLVTHDRKFEAYAAKILWT